MRQSGRPESFRTLASSPITSSSLITDISLDAASFSSTDARLGDANQINPLADGASLLGGTFLSAAKDLLLSQTSVCIRLGIAQAGNGKCDFRTTKRLIYVSILFTCNVGSLIKCRI